MTDQRKPLWEGINDAYHDAIQEVPLDRGKMLQALILAVADWLEVNDANCQMGGDAAATASLLRGELTSSDKSGDMPMTNPKPLWKVMQRAYDESDDGTRNDWKMHHGYAAELRAIADEVVPEEPEPDYYTVVVLGRRQGSLWDRWHQRMEIRQRLLAAVDEAANGGGSNG